MSEFSMLDPAIQQCPFNHLRQLREQDPIHFSKAMNAWYVTRWEDIHYVKKNPNLFSNDFYTRSGWRNEAQRIAEEYRAEHGWARVSTLHRTDPPVHTDYRTLVNRAFTTTRVRQMVPYIESVIHELIDAFIERGSCDFISEFAIPLPCIVIADQLGIARADLPKVRAWSNAMLAPGASAATMSAETALECGRLVVEAQHYLHAVLEDRRRKPRDDIATVLAIGEVNGRKLDMFEICDLFEQLLTGGNESTTGALGSGMMLLLQHPDEMQRLRQEPGHVKSFVEELLRYEPPVLSNMRVVTQDTRLGDIDLPAGSTLILAYASGNRDDAVYPDAESFDPRRTKPATHLAFGAGPHFCPGAPLARQEMQCAFPILLDRLGDIRLADPDDPMPHVESTILRALKTLQIRFDGRKVRTPQDQPA